MIYLINKSCRRTEIARWNSRERKKRIFVYAQPVQSMIYKIKTMPYTKHRKIFSKETRAILDRFCGLTALQTIDRDCLSREGNAGKECCLLAEKQPVQEVRMTLRAGNIGVQEFSCSSRSR